MLVIEFFSHVLTPICGSVGVLLMRPDFLCGEIYQPDENEKIKNIFLPFLAFPDYPRASPSHIAKPSSESDFIKYKAIFIPNMDWLYLSLCLQFFIEIISK